MKKIKKIILTLISLIGLIFLFAPTNFPNNLQLQQVLDSTPKNTVIIVFNSGGWGNTPPEKAEDFLPIVKGIQETLYERGLNSIVVFYERTKNNFFGKITAIKEIFHSFQDQAENLAEEIDIYLEQNPSRKIIMAGLSNGGAFVDATMTKISDEIKNNIFAIEAGVPFWKKPLTSENVLLLDNNGKDSLSKGQINTLIMTLIEAPFRWILAKISGKNIAFSRAIQVPGHQYEWTKVSPEITTFLKEKM